MPLQSPGPGPAQRQPAAQKAPPWHHAGAGTAHSIAPQGLVPALLPPSRNRSTCKNEARERGAPQQDIPVACRNVHSPLTLPKPTAGVPPKGQLEALVLPWATKLVPRQERSPKGWAGAAGAGQKHSSWPAGSKQPDTIPVCWPAAAPWA